MMDAANVSSGPVSVALEQYAALREVSLACALHAHLYLNLFARFDVISDRACCETPVLWLL